MTDEQINIAIAEARGLTVVSDGISHNLTPCVLGTGKYSPEGKGLTFIPNYCNDLNVMHEVWVAKIEGNEVLEDLFTIWLGAICCGEPISDRPDLSDANITIVTNATARQRAEAFLKTIGKWKEHN